MSMHSKVFSYEVDGLSYTVTVYEVDGGYCTDITVLEGAMDVNAVYFGDDDQSDKSAGLGGPLNMNGARLGGNKVQWDEAVELSRPGLGPEGDEKETYLNTGDTLTISLEIESLDDIDVFGVRATSTTTAEGSIKGVSDNPDEPEEPENPEEPEDPTYEKVFFGELFSEEGDPIGGTFILDEEPDSNNFDITSLPEGTEPTFENYLDFFISEDVGGEITDLQAIVFYNTDDEGALSESFRIDAPDGGFQSTDEILDAYDDALAEMETTDDDASDIMSTLTLGDVMEMGAEGFMADETDDAGEDIFAVG